MNLKSVLLAVGVVSAIVGSFFYGRYRVVQDLRAAVDKPDVTLDYGKMREYWTEQAQIRGEDIMLKWVSPYKLEEVKQESAE